MLPYANATHCSGPGSVLVVISVIIVVAVVIVIIPIIRAYDIRDGIQLLLKLLVFILQICNLVQ